MKCRLLNLLSILLCMPVVAMWVRSYLVIDWVSFFGVTDLWSDRGRVHWSGAGQLPAGLRSAIPYWFLLVLSLLPVAWPFIRRAGLASRGNSSPVARVEAPLCPKCGYDLRATPHKCPECGHVPAGAAA
jgi:hypothetical protein